MITLISQKVMDSKNGSLDVLEQNYSKYFGKLGLNLIPVPNSSELLEFYLNLPIERIILTGGGDVGDELSVERDKVEKSLIDLSLKKGIPLLGICRGMQMINSYFGGSIEPLNNKSHIAKNHEIKITEIKSLKVIGDSSEVNSFHSKVVSKNNLSDSLSVFAESDEGFVEGLFHPELPVAGIQWHPERKSPDEKINKKIIDSFLNKKLFWEK